MLRYPKKFTDAEWKKAEKVIKIDATGVGKTLRELEKTGKTLDQGFVALAAGKTDPGKVSVALKAHRDNAKKALLQVNATLQKQKSGTPANKFLGDFSHSLARYDSELKNLKPDDHRGPDWVVPDFNDRVKMVAGD